LDIENVKCVIK